MKLTGVRKLASTRHLVISDVTVDMVISSVTVVTVVNGVSLFGVLKIKYKTIALYACPKVFR